MFVSLFAKQTGWMSHPHFIKRIYLYITYALIYSPGRYLDRFKKAIMFYGYGFAVVEFIVFYYVFSTAFYSDSKSSVFFIDLFHEANLEFVLFPIALAISIVGFYLFCREFKSLEGGVVE